LKNNKKIAIGVLAYNEEKHISDVLSELEKLDVPIFVVNDSSTDRTREILDEFYSRKVIEVINNKKNKGTITFSYHDVDQLNKIIDIIKSYY